MNGAMGWLGRLVVTVLSLLATLSIIGSIAAIPSGSVEGRLGLERLPDERRARAADARAARPAPPPSVQSPPPPQADEAVSLAAAAVAPTARSEQLLHWLEPLTYGVIALAGLMAIGVLFLWRIAAALDARR